MHTRSPATSYNGDDEVGTVPLSWLLRVPGLALRPVHLGDHDPDVAWAHAIELDDPTPFLRGGELVLTTGLRLPRSAAGQASYADRLVGAGAAALGFGTGLRHARLPVGLRRACEEARLPLLEVPLATPFMAISQAVADRLGELRRVRLTETMDQQRTLNRAAVRGGVEAVVRTLARQLGAGVHLCDRTRRELARAGAAGGLPQRLADLLGSGRRGAVSEATPAGWTEVQPVGERPLARLGWLTLARPQPLTVPERLVLTHAVSLVLLLLDEPGAAAPEAEGDLARLLLAGGSDGIASVSFGGGAAVRVVVAKGPGHRLAAAVGEARREAPGSVLAAVDVDARLVVVDAEAERVARILVDALGPEGRVGLGPAVALDQAARTLALAERACGAAEAGAARRSDDLSVTALLADPAVRAAIAAGTDEALTALEGTDLVGSLTAFLDRHGNWDRAASDLGVHRHTVRHRMRKVEQLTGLSLDDPENRLLLHLGVLLGSGRR